MPSEKGNFDELTMKLHLKLDTTELPGKKGNPKSTQELEFLFLPLFLPIFVDHEGSGAARKPWEALPSHTCEKSPRDEHEVIVTGRLANTAILKGFEDLSIFALGPLQVKALEK